MTAFQKASIGIAIGACLATALFLQHQEIARLRQENSLLRQRRSQPSSAATGEQDSTSTNQTNAHSALPDDQFRELLRLRGEVAVLRRETEESQKTKRPPPDGAAPAGTGLSFKDPKFQGYESPAAAFQSTLAARLQGNRAAFLASLTPAEQQREEERMKRLLRDLHKTQAEFDADEAVQISNDFPRVVEMRIVEERRDSADRATLHVRILHRKNSDEGSWMDKELNFQKIGNEWKLDDGL